MTLLGSIGLRSIWPSTVRSAVRSFDDLDFAKSDRSGDPGRSQNTPSRDNEDIGAWIMEVDLWSQQ